MNVSSNGSSEGRSSASRGTNERFQALWSTISLQDAPFSCNPRFCALEAPQIGLDGHCHPATHEATRHPNTGAFELCLRASPSPLSLRKGLSMRLSCAHLCSHPTLLWAHCRSGQLNLVLQGVFDHPTARYRSMNLGPRMHPRSIGRSQHASKSSFEELHRAHIRPNHAPRSPPLALRSLSPVLIAPRR